MILVVLKNVVHEKHFIGHNVQFQKFFEVFAPPHDVLQIVIVPSGIARRK